MHRASVWRGRLDTTTNWALVTSGGMLSFTFCAPDHSHVTLLLANFLALMFLTYEARRFRYFDVWRSRVRMLEENFFLPIIRRNLVSPRSDWREWVAEDLDQPKFKISLLEAIGMRLQRNYIWIFTILYVAWLAKLDGHPHRATSFAEVVGRMSVGPFGGPDGLRVDDRLLRRDARTDHLVAGEARHSRRDSRPRSGEGALEDLSLRSIRKADSDGDRSLSRNAAPMFRRL